MDSAAGHDEGHDEKHDEIWISKTCHVQTPEHRFGSHVREAINAFLTEPPSNEMDDDDDDDDLPDSDDEIWNPTAEIFDLDGDAATWILPYLAFETDLSLLLDSAPPEWVPGVSQGPPTTREDTGFPHIARSRCNLTALSQHYDLYFAAYQDKIYVYRPQRAPRILPPPCLILHPGRTRAARFTPGQVDSRFAHQINNVVVGNLGDLEILAFVYDDGDVAAYYTHTIAQHITQSAFPVSCQRRPTPHPKLFFHENVGLSAWGLAVHTQSRLIAVGSNKHEVTVFAFALSHAPAAADSLESDDSPVVWSGQTALQLQKHLQSRTRTWKITLPLGSKGHNIPSVAFVDDARGFAEKVVAQDIMGNTWMLDIWKIGVQPTYCPKLADRNTNRFKGWGVLILPDSSFKPTDSIRETLGLPQKELIESKQPAHHQGWLDSTCSLFYIKELAVDAETVLKDRNRGSGPDYIITHNQGFIKPSEDAESSSEDSDSNMSLNSSGEWIDLPLTGAAITGSTDVNMVSTPQTTPEDDQRWAAITKTDAPEGAAITDLAEEWQLRRTIIPLFGETTRVSDEIEVPALFYGKDRKNRVKPVVFNDAIKEMQKSIAKDLCIFRSNLTDLELIPLDNKSAGLCCKNVLTFYKPFSRTSGSFGFNRISSERINMLLHIPELHLVVAGSPCGRVALITLTKTCKQINKEILLKRGFRVDRVLPRKEEERKKIRPLCELIGIAMSPAPGSRAKGLDLHPQGQNVTYRLILHYLDHTILMYDIERGRHENDELMIY
ncbi:hypothetical protein QBC43DRAFT_262816 [Cladorrhinum sp. PSN259]|nr:hypothetical protein QBC43DRAFT_262816 [Cladorrhinum sp. PSN259]